MKYVYIPLICLLSVAATVGFFQASKTTSKSFEVARRQWQADSKAKQAQIDALTETASNADQTISNLQAQLNKIRVKLATSEQELATSEQKVSNFETDKNAREDKQAQYQAQVPAPQIIYESGHRVFLFSKVVGIGGGTLLTDATFGGEGGYQHGRKLGFRAAGGVVKVYDVDDLHPLMLKYLSIDPEAAKLAQKQMSEQAQKQNQAQYVQWIQQQQADAIQRQANAKIAIENQKAQAEEAARQTALETERMKANAAMIEAQKPPTQINVIQQSQQTLRGY